MFQAVAKLALTAFIITFLIIVGRIVEAVIPFEYLGYLFATIRLFVMPFDFIIHTPTLFTIIGLLFVQEGVRWTIKAFFLVIRSAGWHN